MTDEAKALVERLLRIGERIPISCPDGIQGCLVYHYRIETDPTCKAAADLIETQAREIERLREALRQYVYETTSLSPREDDGSHWCKISANCLSNARAALAGDSHDQ